MNIRDSPARLEMRYDTIIRTFNSEKSLHDVIDSLRRQSLRPSRIIVIDSGSTDSTLKIAAAQGCHIITYEGKVFNYSKSLNQALRLVSSKHFLVLSSHTILTDIHLLQDMSLLISGQIPVVSCGRNNVPRSVKTTCEDTFDGFNGIWNCCALYRTKLARKIGFNERLPTAEDQYFAAHIYRLGKKTALFEGPCVKHKNDRYGFKKQRNEYVSIAYYTHRPLMSPGSISNLLRESIEEFISAPGSKQLSYHKAALAGRLMMAYLLEPRFRSRYFPDNC